MPSMNRVLIEDVAPRAWDAICDLLGGEDRDYQSLGEQLKTRHGAMVLLSTSR